MKIENGPFAGNYYYTRDHLGSIRELTDSGGNVRARYAYDPFGRQTRLTGDMEADFGFAGMFWSAEANLSLTHFRAYDPELGRWLSRDPLPSAEMLQGPNLYAYVVNDPVNLVDPEGLMDSARAALIQLCARNPKACKQMLKEVGLATTEASAAGGGGAGAAGGALGALAGGAKTLQHLGPPVRDTLQCGAEKTLPGLTARLPDTVNSIVQQVAPRAARLGEAAPDFLNMEVGFQRAQWVVQTLHNTRNFWTRLDVVEEERFLNELQYFATLLFGR
jgi:RHS repeat-associated protein